MKKNPVKNNQILIKGIIDLIERGGQKLASAANSRIAIYLKN